MKKCLIALLLPVSCALTANAQVVYQDSFDNDGIGTNAVIGGGMTYFSARGQNWSDDGRLSNDLSGGNGGATGLAYSNSSFSLVGATSFTLEVTFDISTLVQSDGSNADANRFSFGLIDDMDNYLLKAGGIENWPRKKSSVNSSKQVESA